MSARTFGSKEHVRWLKEHGARDDELRDIACPECGEEYYWFPATLAGLRKCRVCMAVWDEQGNVLMPDQRDTP